MSAHKLLMTCLIVHMGFTPLSFASESHQMMQMVCRSVHDLSPGFVLTVEQTGAFAFEGQIYDGSSLDPNHSNFAANFELIGASIPLRVKVYKNAAAILGKGLKGKDLFEALEDSNLEAGVYTSNFSRTMMSDEFAAKFDRPDGAECYASYFYEYPTLNDYACRLGGAPVEMEGLVCDPLYLVEAKKEVE